MHRAAPSEKLPLDAGLRLSLELEDRDGVVWASTGVLSQSWSDEQVPLIERALLAAKAAYLRLNNEGRKMEAYALEQAMKKAQTRDIVVRVTWTGNADIDLVVQEPAGTVCSSSNPRTIAGGALLADGSSLDKPSKDGFSETYACAQGYAGEYKISVRKVWGEVAGGKVTINLVTDYGTPNQKIVSQQIALDKEVLYVADVKTGHRAEPIAQVQLAKVQAAKEFAGQAVLAQVAPVAADPNNANANLPNNNDPNNNIDQNWAYLAMLRRFADGRGGSGDGFGGFGPGGFGGNGSGGFNGRVPGFVRGGGVGYMPIVVGLPSGTMMMANAVISGDRRYVRVFSTPSFTGVGGSIPTFDTGVGGGFGGGGGGGGGGFGGGGGGGGFGGGGFGGGGAF